jgi:sugar phosphate isomerase/epimerase
MNANTLTRRQAVKALALSGLALPLLGSGPLQAQSQPAARASGKRPPLRVGLATYSLRHLPIDDAIPVMKDLRVEFIGPFRAHIPWAGPTAPCKAIADKLWDAGFTLSGSGVFTLPNDEKVVRQSFENAKAARLQTMVCSPHKEALPMVEKFVKEYNQRIAIHNHGPEDKIWPTPKDAFDAIKNTDNRIGLCIDVAHTARTGTDPIAMIKMCASRLYDLHIRDTTSPVGDTKDDPVEVGSGRLNIIGILSTLMDIGYTGVVALEYEKPSNLTGGVFESLGYIRGVLATLQQT